MLCGRVKKAANLNSGDILMNAYWDTMRRYVEFSGRSSRRQFWLFTMFLFLLGIIAVVIDAALGEGPEGGPGIVFGLLYLSHLLPSLAVTVRRLHDIDRSGWWVLLSFVPLVGQIAMIVFLCMPSTRGPNRFGPVAGLEEQPVPNQASPARQSSNIERLEKLARLKADGTINEGEFESLKAEILAADR